MLFRLHGTALRYREFNPEANHAYALRQHHFRAVRLTGTASDTTGIGYGRGFQSDTQYGKIICFSRVQQYTTEHTLTRVPIMPHARLDSGPLPIDS
jgi:hypothetical protein